MDCKKTIRVNSDLWEELKESAKTEEHFFMKIVKEIFEEAIENYLKNKKHEKNM